MLPFRTLNSYFFYQSAFVQLDVFISYYINEIIIITIIITIINVPVRIYFLQAPCSLC